MQRKTLFRVFAVASLFAAPAAFAHTGAGQTTGFVHGLSHPLIGVDHLLAMVAVGLWAAQRGGRMLWAAPVVFLTTMALAAAVAVAGVGVPQVELGIAASVAAFGLLLLLGRHVPSALGLALIGGFALFHGHAHGSEMPLAVSGAVYGVGFLLATAALHAGGILSGVLVRACASERLLRLSGAALAGGGIYLVGA
jgi:urease accessory protein